MFKGAERYAPTSQRLGADGWNEARTLLVLQPASDSRGEEDGWRWDGGPGGGV